MDDASFAAPVLNPSACRASGNGWQPSPSAETHFAEGILFAIQNDFERAVQRLQQAAASVTDGLGITPWFAAYLEDFGPSRTHSSGLLVRIYENLSQCLYRLDRFTDAAIALAAAARILPDDVSLSDRGKAAHGTHLAERSAGSAASTPVNAGRPVGQWPNQVTLLMATHFTDKLALNRQLAPPGTGLVQTTYSSMIEVFGDGIRNCPKHLIYDRRGERDPEEETYKRNLERFASDHGFDLTETHRGGLQRNFTAAIDAVCTPYVLWVEHDWEFLRPAVDLAAIVAAFERYPRINMIRFNKRPNAIAGFDFLMESETAIDTVPLIRTSAYSNNPQVVRTEKLRAHWLPHCRSDAIGRKFDLSRTAFGVEEPLFKKMIHDIRQLGFEKAHRLWGTYVYGRVDDPPKIRHLGC